MTLIRLLICPTILTLLLACKQSSTKNQSIKRIIIDDVIAEGDISPDSVFNGLIKFYDTASKKLVIEAIYKEGKLNGRRTDYYLNGKIKGIGYYDHGKQNGTYSKFDTSGQLTSKQDFYYELRVGNNLEYVNGLVKSYYFTSFENEELFAVDYDSLINKTISSINDNSFYFFRINDVASITTTDNWHERKEGFIYLVNPPEFNFQYDLCVINPKDSILRVDKTFNMAKTWDTFYLDFQTLKENERYCLRLSYDRELNDKEREAGTMLKRL